MKIRSTVWAAVLVILALAFCVFRIHQGERGLFPQHSDLPRLRGPQFKAAWRKDHDFNYLAKTNNSSKRGGLNSQEVPEEARQIAKQYQDVIYPSVKQYIASHGFLPNTYRQMPRLDAYLAQQQPNKWSVGAFYRLDGTMTSRDVYSHNPPDGPHDHWATNWRFFNQSGKWGQRGFLIYGWDDGRVTFDTMESHYFGTIHAGVGSIGGSAPPGAAGIPATAAQMFKTASRPLK